MACLPADRQEASLSHRPLLMGGIIAVQCFRSTQSGAYWIGSLQDLPAAYRPARARLTRIRQRGGLPPAAGAGSAFPTQVREANTRRRSGWRPWPRPAVSEFTRHALGAGRVEHVRLSA